MQRDEYFRIKKIPLLIGGATTSRVHTAVKIAPHYEGPVVYVPDASRSVGVVQRLLSDERAATLHRRADADYEKVRAPARQQEGGAAGHAGRGARQQDADRLGRLRAAEAEVHRPARVQNYDLAEIAQCIDWGPFFQTWDLAGPFPAILTRRGRRRPRRARVFADGKRMLQAPDRRPLAARPTA